MRKPVPPALYKTKDPLTREDLRRFTAHCQDLLDWIDESVTVEALAAGTGIVITDPTGPTVTVAVDTDPSTTPFVLKDLQGNYTEANTPDPPDRLYMQSAASGGPRWTQIGHLPTGGDLTGLLQAAKVVALHDATNTQLTLGTITNGQVLLRSGTTITSTASVAPSGSAGGDLGGTYPNPTVTAVHEGGGQQLTLATIADGEFLYRTGTTIDGAAVGPLVSGNPWADPPLTPNAFNDEFDSGSPDLAVRGWTIKTTGGTTLTRSGDVDPYSGSGPASGTYWSTIIGSRLFVMVPHDQTVVIFKSITVTTGDCYFARFALQGRRLDVSANLFEDGVNLCAAGSGLPDLNNRVLVATNTNGANNIKTVYYRALSGSYGGQAIAHNNDPVGDIRGIKCLGTNLWDAFTLDSRTGDMESIALTDPAASSMVYFALFFSNPFSSVGGFVPYMFAIDFCRKTTGTAFVAQPPMPTYLAAATAIRETSGPTVLSVGAVSEGALLQRVDSAVVGKAFVGVPALLRRTSPNAYDDEFSSGSPDLATRGWTIANDFSGATLTRIGDVDPTIQPSTIPSTNYRSTITPAGLAIQASVEAYVYKAFPGAGSYITNIYSHRSGSTLTDTSIFHAGVQIADANFISNTSKRFFGINYNGSIYLSFMNTPQAYTTLTTAYSGLTSASVSALSDLYYAYYSYSGGTITWDFNVGNSQFDRYTYGVGSTYAPSGGFNALYAGFSVDTGIAAANSYVVVRFARFYAGIRYVGFGITP